MNWDKLLNAVGLLGSFGLLALLLYLYAFQYIMSNSILFGNFNILFMVFNIVNLIIGVSFGKQLGINQALARFQRTFIEIHGGEKFYNENPMVKLNGIFYVFFFLVLAMLITTGYIAYLSVG